MPNKTGNYRLLLFLWLNCVACDGQYECGDHGRFEYCIDEIPGCVIGCHCHPGYYFDTDTKICEPSVKLAQNYRRRYNIEPTEQDYVTLGVTEPTPTVKLDPINNQVDDITKTADDLGDWLYNQFFKTIENQVINNTQEAVPTRRNGEGPIKNFDLRRSTHKKNKKSKQKRKKTSLRRKLLRITADDSAFDTSEEGHSDSSDSSSSDESDTTFEVNEREHKHKDEKEHGHKKIVIINKKPRPPLPSFIFLPNMDTPFYPPIGLPPPPVMPMYPLVPIPPMPAFPCPEQEGSTTSPPSVITTAKGTGNGASQTTEKLTTENIPEPPKTETDQAVETVVTTESDAAKKGRAGYYRQRKKTKPSFQVRPHMGAINRKPNQMNRQKVQKSRQGMNNPEALRAPYEPLRNEDEIVETPLVEENIFDETQNNEIQSNSQPYTAKADNVDFKYISELIHHVDLNNSRDLPPIEYNSRENVEVFKPRKPHKVRKPGLIPPIENRRFNSDDAYYTNLGRQIASIIRNVDSQNQVDIEIEAPGQNNDNPVFFNDNSHRSFWERSVRSPLKYLNPNKNKYDYLKKSNELLFNIENKVSIVASTAPTLSLREIENIINVMENAQSTISKKQTPFRQYKPSNDNLNFKLWPTENQSQNGNYQGKIQVATPIKQSNYKKMPELKALSMHNIQRITTLITSKRDNRTYNQNFDQSRNPKPLRDLNRTNPQIGLLKSPIFKPNNSTLTIQPYHYFQNNGYSGISKYFQDRNLTPEDDGSHLPRRALGQLLNRPSYFHQEINHFDYFD